MKRICCYPRSSNRVNLAATSCSDGSHWHLSRAEAYEAIKLCLATWVREPQYRKDKGIVRMSRKLPIHGLSCKIGETASEAVRAKEPWAQVMLSNIRGERESASA